MWRISSPKYGLLSYYLLWAYICLSSQNIFTCGAPVLIPLAEEDNYFTLNNDGTYSFAYDTGSGEDQSFRMEVRDASGKVTGRYGYIDPDGILRITNYIADAFGYRATLDVYHKVSQTPIGKPLIVGPVPNDGPLLIGPIPMETFGPDDEEEDDSPNVPFPKGPPENFIPSDDEPLLIIGPLPRELQPDDIIDDSFTDTSLFIEGSLSFRVEQSKSDDETDSTKGNIEIVIQDSIENFEIEDEVSQSDLEEETFSSEEDYGSYEDTELQQNNPLFIPIQPNFLQFEDVSQEDIAFQPSFQSNSTITDADQYQSRQSQGKNISSSISVREFQNNTTSPNRDVESRLNSIEQLTIPSVLDTFRAFTTPPLNFNMTGKLTPILGKDNIVSTLSALMENDENITSLLSAILDKEGGKIILSPISSKEHSTSTLSPILEKVFSTSVLSLLLDEELSTSTTTSLLDKDYSTNSLPDTLDEEGSISTISPTKDEEMEEVIFTTEQTDEQVQTSHKAQIPFESKQEYIDFGFSNEPINKTRVSSMSEKPITLPPLSYLHSLQSLPKDSFLFAENKHRFDIQNSQKSKKEDTKLLKTNNSSSPHFHKAPIMFQLPLLR